MKQIDRLLALARQRLPQHDPICEELRELLDEAITDERMEEIFDDLVSRYERGGKP